jgi:N-glycosylase/DNA lyase
MFGRRISFKGSFFYTFPDPSAIAGSCRSALSECKLGYRSAYVFETACTIADDAGWEDLVASHPYEQARSDLMRLRGVGPKAADCILLFAFQKYEAFPVDVWIRRIMRRHYLPQIGSSPASGSAGDNMIRRFAREYFGEYCGYAQEYLFAAREE